MTSSLATSTEYCGTAFSKQRAVPSLLNTWDDLVVCHNPASRLPSWLESGSDHWLFVLQMVNVTWLILLGVWSCRFITERSKPKTYIVGDATNSVGCVCVCVCVCVCEGACCEYAVNTCESVHNKCLHECRMKMCVCMVWDAEHVEMWSEMDVPTHLSVLRCPWLWPAHQT